MKKIGQLACLVVSLCSAAAMAQVRPGDKPAAPTARTAPSPKPAASATGEREKELCTKEPRSEWLAEDEMRLLAEHRGYRIRTFKVTYSSCYEIYGFDKTGRIVEAYFNPINARLVRQNYAN